jgi:hypothetical protein
MTPIISRSIAIVAYKGQAFLPTLVQSPERYGGFWDVEPVHCVDMTSESLLFIIRQLLSNGHEVMSHHPTAEEIKHRDNPLVRATGVRDWKVLDRHSIGYYINWLEDSVELLITRTGSGEWDTKKSRTLPLDTSLEGIIEVILDDFKSRDRFCIWRRIFH